MARRQAHSGFYKPERFTERVFAPVTKAIGEVALAWNSLHEGLGYVFWFLLRGVPGNVAPSIWNAATFDRPKRQMLRLAVETTPSKELDKFPNIVEDVVWLLNKADEIEDARNNAIHSPLFLLRRNGGIVGYGPDQIMPDVLLGNTRAKRLGQKDIVTEFRWCRDASLVLRDFSYEIHRALVIHKGAWPRRPSLPNRGQKKTPRSPRRRALKE